MMGTWTVHPEARSVPGLRIVLFSSMSPTSLKTWPLAFWHAQDDFPDPVRIRPEVTLPPTGKPAEEALVNRVGVGVIEQHFGSLPSLAGLAQLRARAVDPLGAG